MQQSVFRAMRWGIARCGGLLLVSAARPRKLLVLIALISLEFLLSANLLTVDAAVAIDFGTYKVAANYCRSDVVRSLALSSDHRILCFDGYLSSDQDLSLVASLQPGGLFVVRSQGGDDVAMMKLADLLRERDATVVVHDYCLLGCASYLVIASAKTVILRDALVAWRPLVEKGYCVGFRYALDDGPPRFDVGHCPSNGRPLLRTVGPIYQLRQKFMKTRRVSPMFEEPPQSIKIRRTLLRIDLARLSGKPDVMWTWHPRFQPSLVKTEIVYEAYPESQEEIVALTQRLGLQDTIIYDP
jgi:hypothetical protein